MKKLIAISLSPNTFPADVTLALKHFFSPMSYIKGESVRLLEQWFRQYLKVSYGISFSSGRGAFYAILRELGVKKDDEVILQSFTCVAVPNSILAVGARPIYIDIDSSLTMDPAEIESKITSKTKVILVQHTFGIPTEMDQVMKIARKHGLFVVEDCAHGIGGVYKGKKLGTFGVASFFSFGRDKAFSSVFGGMVVTNNQALGKRIRAYQRQLSYPGFVWIARQLFHPIVFSYILPLYTKGMFGKGLIVILQKLSLLSFPVTKKEKNGGIEEDLIKKLPNSLASLALFQLKRITEFNTKRQKIAQIYEKKLTFLDSNLHIRKTSILLRFPVLTDRRDDVIRFFRKRNVYLGAWYSQIIDPIGVDYKKILYQKGMTPKAEIISSKILNLPTFPRMETADAEKIVSLFKEYVKSKRN